MWARTAGWSCNRGDWTVRIAIVSAMPRAAGKRISSRRKYEEPSEDDGQTWVRGRRYTCNVFMLNVFQTAAEMPPATSIHRA
jgi:hypothetical protein